MTHINWIWTDHIRWQIIERKIPKELVETVLNNPDEVVPSKHNRMVYQKIMGDKLIRVVAEEDRLMTVYLTDKVKNTRKDREK